MLPLGYNLGTDAVDKLLDNGMFKKILSGAAILSMFIMGSMTFSYVNLKTVLELGSVNVQSILNSILPGMLPVSLVMLIYYLMARKQVNATLIILCIMVVSLIGSFFGIL